MALRCLVYLGDELIIDNLHGATARITGGNGVFGEIQVP